MESSIATIESANVDSFSVNRVTRRKTKNGIVEAIKTRSILGVLSSGNKAEREAATVAQAAIEWRNCRHDNITNEFVRVFSLNIDKINVLVTKKLAEKPDAAVVVINMEKPTKRMCKQIIAGAMRFTDPDTATGEKAIYCAVAQKINELEAEIQKMLEAK